jgi:raffinose/stachyose/melibiose transport system permease protein
MKGKRPGSTTVDTSRSVVTEEPGQILHLVVLVPLASWTFQGHIPAVLASVVLATLPVLVLYVIGRRQLMSGLTARLSK